jgi:gamma-glutamyl:cysteine ligase YbdK (ATP-grasp superfamily)
MNKMFFHEKKKDLEDNFNKYQVLCGIEEEFLLIDHDGTLVEAADQIMKTAADIIDNNPDLLNSLRVRIRSLDAEPNPAQIEYVTLPIELGKVESAVRAGRQLLIDAAKRLGVKLFAQSLHPIQSDPHPIVGTHINVSVQKPESLMKSEYLKAVHNYLWNYLPEIIGITANSPIYQGKENNVASNRCANSTVLKPNGFAQIQVPDDKPALIQTRYYGRMRFQLKIGRGDDEFAKKVIANERGERLVDITPRGPFTNIDDDKDEAPTRNRVEIRIIDVQQRIQDVLDMAYLCSASALHAIHLDRTGEIKPDPYHKQNMDNAIANGHNASLRRGNGMEIPLEESVSSWMNDISKYKDYLGVKIENLPYEKLQRAPIQKQLEVNYVTRKIEKMRQQGNEYVIAVLNSNRIVTDDRGEQYKVPGGKKIQGKLSTQYKFTYEEKDDIVQAFDEITVINTLEVQGLSIPLEPGDKILRVRTRSEDLIDRLLRGFF